MDDIQIVFFGDNILSNEDSGKSVHDKCNIRLQDVVSVLIAWGRTENDMQTFIDLLRKKSPRVAYHSECHESGKSCRVIPPVDLMIGYLNHCAAAGATISAATGSLYSTLHVPVSCSKAANQLRFLVDTNSLLGNFFQASLTTLVPSTTLWASHPLGLRMLTPEQRNGSQPGPASDLSGSELQLTLYNVDQFEYSACFRTCSKIFKTIVAMDKLNPCNSVNRKFVLLCLSPEANSIKLWNIFAMRCLPADPDESCYHTWLSLVLPALQANPIFSQLLSGVDGDELTSNGGYYLLLVTFGENFHTWVSSETAKCLTRIEMGHKEIQRVHVSSCLQQRTDDCLNILKDILSDDSTKLTADLWDNFCADAQPGKAKTFSELVMKRLAAVYASKVLRCEIGPAESGKWFMATGFNEECGLFDSEDEAFDAGVDLALVPRRVFTAAVGKPFPFSLFPKAPSMDHLLLISTCAQEDTLFRSSIPFLCGAK